MIFSRAIRTFRLTFCKQIQRVSMAIDAAALPFWRLLQMSSRETGRQANRPKRITQASQVPKGAVHRAAALKEWLKACEAVKKKYRRSGIFSREYRTPIPESPYFETAELFVGMG